MPRQPQRILAAVLLTLLALLWAACSDAPGSAPAATVPAVTAGAEAPPAPTATAAPDAADLGPGSVELIRRGWQSIVERYIQPPDARDLLLTAWREVSAEARARGITPQAQPALEGSPEEMWLAFAEAYGALLDRSAEETWAGLRWAALTGMTKSLDDCHTFFLPPARTEQLTDIRTGRASGGVGVELAPVKPSYLREVLADGPAEQAGLKPGDVVLAVDGRDVTQLGIEVISELLRGEAGTEVSLEIRRPSSGSRLSVPLTRALVRPATVQGGRLEDGVGYLRIRSFTTGPGLLEALDTLISGFEADGVRAWVLDLRDNPGGDRNLELYGRFLGDVTAERTLLRDGELETQESEGEAYPDRPLAVLVNSSSASLAEIFAAMLQDYGRARVFGTQTARCAGFVSLETYPDGSTLGITIAHSLTPVSEKPVWQTGVIPDVAVRQSQEDIAAGRDPVLGAALAWLASLAP